MEKEHGCLLDAAGVAMWRLVERYTGNVGYRGGAKAEGLAAIRPVIDCSGWVSLLLSTGMKAINAARLVSHRPAGGLAIPRT
jgi:hypothetical protein